MKSPTSPRDDAFEEEMRNDEVVRLYQRLADENTSEAIDQRVLEIYRRIVPPAPLPLLLFHRLLSYCRSHPFVDVLKCQWRRLSSPTAPLAMGGTGGDPGGERRRHSRSSSL